jgi:predicted secreted Zn-dependent protease
MMLWNVSEGLALDKAGLNFTKGHSQKHRMFARENAQTLERETRYLWGRRDCAATFHGES